jgi:hypothetical protein
MLSDECCKVDGGEDVQKFIVVLLHQKALLMSISWSSGKIMTAVALKIPALYTHLIFSL